MSPRTLAVRWTSASRSSLIPTMRAAAFSCPCSSVAPLRSPPVGYVSPALNHEHLAMRYELKKGEGGMNGRRVVRMLNKGQTYQLEHEGYPMSADRRSGSLW